VVIPVTTQHYTMLARNLLYTGVTRGKRLVVLVAQRKAIGIAVRGGSMKRRWTKLKEWMAGTSSLSGVRKQTLSRQPHCAELRNTLLNS
jgi:exodeoxyribonuclease V alpha subunit